MTFTIKNPYGKQFIDLAKAKVFINAKRKIICYKNTPTEIILNKYFIENYKTSLKNICLSLLKNCKILDNGQDVIVKFTDIKLNKLADFITYGDGKIKGSQILVYAFKELY